MIFFRIFPALALITLALTAFSVFCASRTFRITARFAVSFFLAIKQCRIIFQKSLNQCHQRYAGSSSIHHQNRRQTENPSNLKGAPLYRHAPQAVKISHDPFRHHKMVFHAPGQFLSHMCSGLKKAVQVSIFHSQNPTVEQAVNVVRSALKRSRIISLPLKEGQKAAGYHRLPAAASRSRYHNSCHCISPSSSFGSCITATYTGFCAFGIW